jgi:hypothetical protein
MKKAITAAFLFCLASSIANAQEVIELNKPMKCGNAQFVMNHFAQEYGELPLWVGKEKQSGSYITILVNKEKKTWTVIQYDASLACVLGAGEGGSSTEAFF